LQVAKVKPVLARRILRTPFATVQVRIIAGMSKKRQQI
jgi:hypothetical protein